MLLQGWVEGIGNLLDGVLLAGARDGNDIEAVVKRDILHLEIGISGGNYVLSLGLVHSAHWIYICALAGLHLYEYQHIILGGYDVELKMIVLPVAGHYGIALRCQVLRCGVLAPFADILVGA